MVLSDVNYNLLTALQSKLEALEVYRIYLEDCREAGDEEGRQLFEELMRDDERHAERLQQELERRVREGTFH